MKRVVKNFDLIPAILTSQRCDDLKTSALIEMGQHQFDTTVYGHDDVRTALDGIYNSKCAFCETDPTAGMTIQVEHFRPKAKVTGILLHPGYYWLGYEWSNLLLACSSCNNKKRNQFPITSEINRKNAPPATSLAYRADQPELISELALVLNPEIINDVDAHFTYNSSGEIVPITASAERTRDVLGLNRGNLVKARKKILDTCINNILKSFDDKAKGIITTQDQLEYGILLRIRDLITVFADNMPYSQFAKHCWDNFQSYVVDIFKPQHRNIVEKTFKRAKEIYESV